MITFKEALKQGFRVADEVETKIIGEYVANARLEEQTGMQLNNSSYKFEWKDGDNEYELWFEKLLYDDQYYVALYKNMELMTEKVVVKPG